MTFTEKTCSPAKRSSRRTTSAHETGTQVIHQQVIHQIIIPETPAGLIGEKVQYSERYLKLKNGWTPEPLPECGYFTITKAVLEDDGRVMVALHPHPYPPGFMSGTHICLANMVKYKQNEKS
jgi:hypothetical protein